MIKIRHIFLPILMCALFAPQAKADYFTVGDLRYSIQDDQTSVVVDKYWPGDNKDLEIPASVTDEDTGISYTVTGIYRQTFYNASLNSITFPATLEDIGVYAFWKAKFNTVNFAEGLKRMGYGAFKDCTNLTKITLPESLEELGYEYTVTGFDGFVFAGCTSLKEVSIGSKIETIPTATFSGCSALDKVTIANGVKKMGERVFEDCAALTALELPSSMEQIERAAFMRTGFTTFTWPGSVKVIPNSAFLYCRALTGFTIEEGVEEVGKQSFAACYGYDKVICPNSVEWIHADAFQGADKVTEIRLGTGLRRLGHASLAVWSPEQATNTPEWSVTDVYCMSTVPPVFEPNDDHLEELSTDFFFGAKEFTDELQTKFYAEVKLHVPAEAVAAYKEAEIWKNFVNIIPEGDVNDATVSFTTTAADFSGVIVTVDGETVELQGNSAAVDAEIGSTITVAPAETATINSLTATGASVTETGYTYTIVVSEAAATVAIDWSAAIVKVETEETLVDGVKAGTLLLSYDGEDLPTVMLPLGATVTFKPVAEEGWEFVNVVNASDSDKDAGTSYTAVRDDIADGVTFKAIFKKTSGISSIAGDSRESVTVYNLAGIRIAEMSPAALSQLPDGLYILKTSDSVIKYRR